MDTMDLIVGESNELFYEKGYNIFSCTSEYPDDLVQFIVDRSTPLFKGFNYHIPDRAAGACFDASEAILNMCMREIAEGTELDDDEVIERLDIACAEHPDYIDYDGVIDEDIVTAIGFTNHFAFIIDENTIVDYTLRQFDPQVPYPFVGNHEEWGNAIAKRWNKTPVFTNSCR